MYSLWAYRLQRISQVPVVWQKDPGVPTHLRNKRQGVRKYPEDPGDPRQQSGYQPSLGHSAYHWIVLPVVHLDVPAAIATAVQQFEGNCLRNEIASIFQSAPAGGSHDPPVWFSRPRLFARGYYDSTCSAW